VAAFTIEISGEMGTEKKLQNKGKNPGQNLT